MVDIPRQSLALLLLPVLDRYLFAYAYITEKCLDLTTLTAEEALRTQKGSEPLDSLTTSLRSLLLRGANVAHLVETSTVNTLRVLYTLVKHSSHVRTALVCDNYSKLEAVPPEKKKDPKNEAKTDNQGSSSTTSDSSNTAQGDSITITNQHVEIVANGEATASANQKTAMAAAQQPRDSVDKSEASTSTAKQVSPLLWGRKKKKKKLCVVTVTENAELLTSMLTAYLTPYITLVHQGKGTEYPR